jgi:hypothetical protein
LQDEEVSNIKRVLEVLLRGRSGPVTPRPKFTTVSIQQDENKRELLYTLMGARGNDKAAAAAARCRLEVCSWSVPLCSAVQESTGCLQEQWQHYSATRLAGGVGQVQQGSCTSSQAAQRESCCIAW